MKIKLNENGSKILKEVLSQAEGPFSKSTNVMLALELMEKGQELASNQITKVHLTNIIKAICTHLEWTEELIEQDESVENVNEEAANESTEEKPNEKIPDNTNAQIVTKNSQICKFFRFIH